MIYLYNLILAALLVLILPAYALRQFLRGGSSGDILERLTLGYPRLPRPEKGERRYWIHAASVGELKAALPLVNHLKAGDAKATFILSIFSTSPREYASTLTQFDHVFYFPLDLGLAARRALRLLKPTVVLFIDTEIWPGFLHRAAAAKVPVCILNGRLSDRTLGSYRLLFRWLPGLSKRIQHIGAQTAEDRERWLSLGFPSSSVSVTGNMKFDCDLELLGAQASRFAGQLKGIEGRFLVAGSTHQGDEEIILPVFRDLIQKHDDLRLILAPRHLHRVGEVEESLRRFGLDSARFTALDGAISARVIILDTVGDLAACYACATAVIVGGTFEPVGGHNLFEPAVLGKPVLFGPHTHSQRDSVARLLAAEESLQVQTGEELVRCLERIISDTDYAHVVGARCREAFSGSFGATVRNAEILGDLFDKFEK